MVTHGDRFGGFGFAIARFGHLRQLQAAVTQRSSEPSLLAQKTWIVGLVIVGIVTIALAALRCNQVFWQIEREYRP